MQKEEYISDNELNLHFDELESRSSDFAGRNAVFVNKDSWWSWAWYLEYAQMLDDNVSVFSNDWHNRFTQTALSEIQNYR